VHRLVRHARARQAQRKAAPSVHHLEG
jgi:hypothetical protein